MKVAAQRLLDAEALVQAGAPGAWQAQREAAVDYWLQVHPEEAHLRRPASDHVPTLAEIAERADALERNRRTIDGGVHDALEQQARWGWSGELYAGLYDPIEQARAQVRAGDPSGIETLVRFLEADVYCFGSGYMKADVADALKRTNLDPAVTERARAVILAVVDSYDRREFRAYVRLARHVDGPEFRGALRARLLARSPHTRRHARWMLDGLGEPALLDAVPSPGDRRT